MNLCLFVSLSVPDERLYTNLAGVCFESPSTSQFSPEFRMLSWVWVLIG